MFVCLTDDTLLLLVQTRDTAVIYAAREGHAEVVKKLAELGVNISAANHVILWHCMRDIVER